MSNRFYSSDFARNVVQEFYESYPRATEYFANSLNLSLYEVLERAVYYFRYAQRRWEVFKKTIKNIEKYEQFQESADYIKKCYTFEYQQWLEDEIKLGKFDDFRQLLLDLDKHFDLQSISDEVIQAD